LNMSPRDMKWRTVQRFVENYEVARSSVKVEIFRAIRRLYTPDLRPDGVSM
jgi:hypothetical protein